MNTQTAIRITAVQIGDFVIVPGNQNNAFTVSEIVSEAFDRTLLIGKSPNGKSIEYRGENYFSVRKLVAA